MEIVAHNHDPASNEEDGFRSLEELGQREFLHRNPKSTPFQRPDGPDLDTSGRCLAQPRLEGSLGDSKGTRGISDGYIARLCRY
jgi:hypothetical protein